MEAEHRHCKVCGKVCGLDEETCSDRCKTKRETMIKSRKNLTNLLMVMMAVLVVIFAASFVR
ncbi:MAG: DUF2116 family Zn-ribbon domain-containing protein [Thermoplasmata archaeon]|nr:DUF2116 family Zn-ribbon domain-containing protein [Thermoplasmata archaeon]MCI4341990.1 DUF2116 family Zn-ribbon domain-containing protein [Thermoplasmata archaeon]